MPDCGSQKAGRSPKLIDGCSRPPTAKSSSLRAREYGYSNIGFKSRIRLLDLKNLNPKLISKVRIGGIVSRAAHPHAKNRPLSGGPQMVEISRNGKRVYFTNSLYSAIDAQFYPGGIEGWMVKLDTKPGGGIAFDERFFVNWPSPHRPHQVRLEGGDCSSDSYCYA